MGVLTAHAHGIREEVVCISRRGQSFVPGQWILNPARGHLCGWSPGRGSAVSSLLWQELSSEWNVPQVGQPPHLPRADLSEGKIRWPGLAEQEDSSIVTPEAGQRGSFGVKSSPLAVCTQKPSNTYTLAGAELTLNPQERQVLR